MKEMKLHREYIQILGPAKIVVASGKLKLGGKVLEKGRNYLIPSGKSTVGFGDCILEISQGSNSKIEILEGKTIPRDWDDALAYILKERPHIILILGGVDTGKTTLITHIANELLERGKSVAIVDADIGQSDIGPPATIALGVPGEPFSMLYDVKPEQMYFVGSSSPSGHLLPLVVGTKLLVEKAIAEFVLIDTTGLIHKAGRALKRHKIELVNPDLILALQRKYELEPVLEPLAFKKVIRLRVSEYAKEKSRRERRFLRELAFKKYFENAKEIFIDLDRVKFIGSYISPEENLLVGLADEENNTLGLGIIEGIDFKKIKIFTPVTKEKIRIVQVGDVKITREGKELEKVKPRA